MAQELVQFPSCSPHHPNLTYLTSLVWCVSANCAQLLPGIQSLSLFAAGSHSQLVHDSHDSIGKLVLQAERSSGTVQC